MSLFDNLIPWKGNLFGAQTAGWTPGAPVARGLGCRILADQMIPVAPGIELGSDVYLPKQPGRYPAVIAFSAYTKELHASGAPTGNNEVGSPPVFTDRGYAHVIVERRGMGISGGDSEVFFNDRDVDDHERVIAWVAGQPWCDGQVVLYGISYYGCVQAMVAARKPPALKGFFCSEICTDFFRHIAAFGGTPNLFFMNIWLGANFSESIMRLRVPPIARAAASQLLNSSLKKMWWPAVRRRVPLLMGGFMKAAPIKPMREIWVNFMIDAKSRETCVMPEGPYRELSQIEVPFVTVYNCAMFNVHQFGSFELFEKAGTPAGRKWLIVAEAAYELPVYAWQLEALAFFDHVLHGADNGYAQQAPVRYWVDNAQRYESAPSFPRADLAPLRIYPAAEGGLRFDASSGGADTWAAIPLGAPVPSKLDEVVNQQLVYELAVERELSLVGAVTANLRFSSNEIDSYVLVRLSRVDVHGHDHLLSLGAISPARRRLDATRGSHTEIAIDTSRPEPLQPGVPVTLRFSLTPGPTLLRPSDKLRLTIASRTDLVESDMAHDHAHFQLQVPPYFSRNTLHLGPDNYIELQRAG